MKAWWTRALWVLFGFASGAAYLTVAESTTDEVCPDEAAIRSILTALAILTGFLMAAVAFVAAGDPRREGPVTARSLRPVHAVTRFLILLYAYLVTIAVLVAALLVNNGVLAEVAVAMSIACWCWTLSVPLSLMDVMAERLSATILETRRREYTSWLSDMTHSSWKRSKELGGESE